MEGFLVGRCEYVKLFLSVSRQRQINIIKVSIIDSAEVKLLSQTGYRDLEILHEHSNDMENIFESLEIHVGENFVDNHGQ